MDIPPQERYEMEIEGNPDVTVVVKGFQSEVGGEGPEHGIVGTAAHCVTRYQPYAPPNRASPPSSTFL